MSTIIFEVLPSKTDMNLFEIQMRTRFSLKRKGVRKGGSYIVTDISTVKKFLKRN